MKRPGPGTRPIKGLIDEADMRRREAPDYIASLVDKLKSIIDAAGISLPWRGRRRIWNDSAKTGLDHSARSIKETSCRPVTL
jgi:hypothetical protein